MSSEWKQCTLSQIGKIITGKTPSTNDKSNYCGDIPFLTPSDDLSGKYVVDTQRKLSSKGVEKVKNCVLPKNAVCVSCIGSDLGKIVITTSSTVTNQQFNSIIVDTESFDVDFVYYALVLLGQKLNYLSKTSTAIPIVNKTMFSQQIISCPDLKMQRVFGRILSTLDNKIQANKLLNDNLLNQVRTIFDNWFTYFSHFNGVRSKDWKMGTISDLAENIVCGKTPSTKNKSFYGNEIPFITIPDMHNSTYIVKTERCLSKLGGDSQYNKYLPPNSICVSCIGTAGLVSFVHTISQTNQQINSIVPKANISPYYVFLLMEKLSPMIQALGSSGSTIANLNKEQFSQIEVLIPSSFALSQFDLIVKPLFETIRINQVQNIRLTSLRDYLLPRLLNGEVQLK